MLFTSVPIYGINDATNPTEKGATSTEQDIATSSNAAPSTENTSQEISSEETTSSEETSTSLEETKDSTSSTTNAEPDSETQNSTEIQAPNYNGPLELTGFDGTISWGDDVEEIPESVTINLLRDGEKITQTTTSAENGWFYCFLDVVAKDTDGTPYNFSVEQEELEGFSTKYTDGETVSYVPKEGLFDIINVNNKNNIEGKIFWDKGEKLPEQVVVKLLQNEKEYKTIEVTKNDNWKYIFENVPLYDNEGKSYSYSIEQEALEGFLTQYTNSSKNGLVIKFNENCETEGVEYDWVEVYYQLGESTYCAGRWGGKTLAGKELYLPTRDFYLYFHSDDYEDNWYGLSIDSIEEVDCTDRPGSMKNLPSGMTATELKGNNYPETSHGNYGNKKDLFWHYQLGETSDTPKEGFFNIENTDTRLEIRSNIKWEGEGDKPEEIKINLLRDGEIVESTTTSETKNWEYVFSGLASFDEKGNEYKYSIEQEELWGWDTTYKENPTNGLKIVFDKECKAQSGSYDYCRLYYKDNDEIHYIGQFNPNDAAGKYIEVPKNDFYLYFYSNSSNNNYYGISIASITRIPSKEVDSNVVSSFPTSNIIELSGDEYPETNHPYGNNQRLLWHYSGEERISTTPESGLYDITNKSLADSISGSIMWTGKQNIAYPESVDIKLYRDGKYFMTTTTDASKNWKYCFEGIMLYDKDGHYYDFSVEQEKIPGFNTEYVDANALEITFSKDSRTESANYDYIDIFYKKDGKLYKTGRYGGSIGGITISVPSNEFYLYWRTDGSGSNYYGFKIDSIKKGVANFTQSSEVNLPNYEIIELKGDNYPESEHNGYGDDVNQLWHYTAESFGPPSNIPKDGLMNIINTSIMYDIKGTVIWEGNKNATRPNEVTLDLYRNDEYLKSTTTSSSKNWEYCFDNVLPYDEEGNDYKYVVKQKSIDGFSTKYTNKKGDGLKITFNGSSYTASSNDYVEIYYEKDGNIYKLGRYSQSALTEYQGTIKTIYVPTSDFYLYWKTGNLKIDSSDPDRTYYGFSIDNIESASYDTMQGPHSKIPVNEPIELTGKNYPESGHNNYEPNDKKMWHYSFEVEESTSPKEGLVNIINTSDTIQIKDKVIWKGDKNADKPDSVTIKLLRNGEVCETTTTNESNNWEYIFNDIKPYDENGVEYSYSIEQAPINNFDTVYANKTGGLAITFNKNFNAKSGDISIYYVKDGKSYLAGMYTPTQLAGLTVKVPTKDFYLYWRSEGSFNGEEDGFLIDSIKDIDYNTTIGEKTSLPDRVPNEISGSTYPKSSESKNSGDESIYWHYTKDLETSKVPKKDFFSIINTSLTISIESQIDWINTKETKYPQNVTVSLFRNGELVDTATTSAKEDWIYIFKNLPQYDENGKEYKYSVEEEPLNGFITTYKNKENGLSITFSEKCKTESGNNDYISLYYKKDGRTYCVGTWGSMNLAGRTINIPSNDFYITFTTNEEDDNYYGFEIESIKDIIYNSVVGERSELPEGYEVVEVSGNTYPESIHNGYGNNVKKMWHYSSNVITKDNKDDGFYKITNTLDSHDIESYIRWKDEGNEEKRPENVTVTLTQNGKVYDKVVTNAENNWRYSFEDLPNRDENGELYHYVISQDEEIADYNTKYVKQVKSEINGTTIKFANDGYISYGDYVEIYYRYNSKLYKTPQYNSNDLSDRTISIPSNDFYLYWHTDNSGSNYYGFKVDYVNNTDIDTVIGSVTDSLPNFPIVTLEGNSYPESEHDGYGDNVDKLWHYIVSGEEYSETPSEGYDGIINTCQYQPIKGTVTWRDIKEVEHGEVVINLFQDGKLLDTTTTDAEKEWAYSFDNVPMKKADGSDYAYTVETEPVENYTTYYTGNIDNKGLRIRFNNNFPKNAIDNMKVTDKSNFISIYYKKDGQIYKKGSYQYLGGLIVDVPSTNIYIAWDTKGAADEFYKNSIVDMELIDITKLDRDEASKLPDYDYIAEVTGTDYPRAGDAEYDSVSQVLWHYTYGETTPINKAFDIVNIYNYISVSGHKSWVDSEDYEEENEYLANSPIGYFLSKVFPGYTKSRNIPETLAITLYKDGQRYDTKVISAKDNWDYDFGELPIYNENGTKISYKIQEEATRTYKPVYRNNLGYSSLNPDDNYFSIYNQQVKNVRVNFISEIEGADILDPNLSDTSTLANEVRSPEESYENMDLNKDTVYGFKLTLEGMSYPSLIPKQELDWEPGEGETENDRPKRVKQEDEYIYNEFGNKYFMKKDAPVEGSPAMESVNNKYNGILPGQIGVEDSNKEKLVIANLKPGIYKITENDDVFFNYVSMEALNSVEGIYFINDSENNANYLVVTSGIYEHKELTIKVTNKVEPNKYYEGKELEDNKFITISGNTVSIEDLKNWGIIPDEEEDTTEYKTKKIEGSSSSNSYIAIN